MGCPLNSHGCNRKSSSNGLGEVENPRPVVKGEPPFENPKATLLAMLFVRVMGPGAAATAYFHTVTTAKRPVSVGSDATKANRMSLPIKNTCRIPNKRGSPCCSNTFRSITYTRHRLRTTEVTVSTKRRRCSDCVTTTSKRGIFSERPLRWYLVSVDHDSDLDKSRVFRFFPPFVLR